MDGLCFNAGITGLSSSPSMISGGGGGILDCRTLSAAQVSVPGRSAGGVTTNATGISSENSTATAAPQKTGFSFTYPLRSLWPGRGKRNAGISLEDVDVVAGDGERGGEEIAAVEETENEAIIGSSERKRGNWVLKILHVKSLWTEQRKSGIDDLVREEKKNDDTGNDQSGGCSCGDENESGVCRVDDEEEEEEIKFDSALFSSFLRRVSLMEAKLYGQMSFLGNLAYSVPKIKPENLLKYHGLRFVTSSVEKKSQLTNAEKEQISAQVQETEKKPEEDAVDGEQQSKKNVYRISASSAYQIVASAASYVHSHTRSLPFKSLKTETRENVPAGGSKIIDEVDITSSDMASFVATTNSVTAVVAAKEEMKQAVAKDLNSAHSSPCEWFICDDDQSGTRFFVIQGSESIAAWQANLLFEPIQFEGLGVLVHRGIYEAAKGIYEQMLPEVRAHLKSRGDSATFRFTGHSLGGSLSLLVNLMLLIRGEVPLSFLLPVITFGSPSIMCGGDQLLSKLGLSRNHVQAITMHRDIVPRAFSCNYPDHVAELLKAVNGNFRNLPCLKNQKLLYAPMGEVLILQPDEKFSPNHHLLPAGSGLYVLSCPGSDSGDSQKLLRAAKTIFFNSPHPLEILSDRSAYGSDGTINRDHDMHSYLRSVRGVIRQELNHIRKAKREHRRQVWWPLVATSGIYAGIAVGKRVESSHIGQNQLNFPGVFRTGRDSIKRFSRLVASQHMHLFVVLLFPVRLLLLGAYTVISFR